MLSFGVLYSMLHLGVPLSQPWFGNEFFDEDYEDNIMNECFHKFNSNGNVIPFFFKRTRKSYN